MWNYKPPALSPDHLSIMNLSPILNKSYPRIAAVFRRLTKVGEKIALFKCLIFGIIHYPQLLNYYYEKKLFSNYDCRRTFFCMSKKFGRYSNLTNENRYAGKDYNSGPDIGCEHQLCIGRTGFRKEQCYAYHTR